VKNKFLPLIPLLLSVFALGYFCGAKNHPVKKKGLRFEAVNHSARPTLAYLRMMEETNLPAEKKPLAQPK
jgi:hypothetical protein